MAGIRQSRVIGARTEDARLGLQGLEPARGEDWLRGRLWTPHGTHQARVTDGGTGTLRGKIICPRPRRKKPRRAGAQTLVCPAPEPTPPTPIQPIPPSSCSLLPPGLTQTAGLSRENLPSSREPSLITKSWSVRFLCLSLVTGLISPGHNFLKVQLPPPPAWEFLGGWGQGTRPCSQLGPSTGSSPEEVLGKGLSDGWVSSC